VPKSTRNIRYLSLFFILIFSQIYLESTRATVVSCSSEEDDLNYISAKIDFSKIYEHVRYLSNLTSRVTGYPGSYLAAEYIKEVFEEYGLNVTTQKYQLTVPLEIESKIILDSYSINAHTLWPNSIQTCSTPPEGISGRIIYVGKGELADFKGLDVEGSIVLMDFNSGNNWLNAANLGAKAVIFIQPQETSYVQAIKKFIDTPIYFPRMYVNATAGILLRKAAEEGKEIRIISRMFYRNVESENILAVIEGKTYPDNIIVVSAHYDSWSVVPFLSPAAHEAVSVATLLELAKYFKENPPERSIWFVALSGHWQALAGAREFVEKFYFSEDVNQGQLKPLMWINIADLEESAEGLALIRRGYYSLYTGYSIETRYAWITKKFFTEYLLEPNIVKKITDLTGLKPTIYVKSYFTNAMFWGGEQFPYLLDSEPAEMTGGIAFSFSSISYKMWRGTPINDIDSIDFQRLKPQIIIISYLISRLVNERDWGINWRDVAPARVIFSPPRYCGFITLKGRVVEYNLTKGWYTNVPTSALVRIRMPIPYPFSQIFTLTEQNGSFSVHGLPLGLTIPYPLMIDAWVLNEHDGQITYAPDLGIYGSKAASSIVSPLTHPTYATVIVARFIPVEIFDVIDPRTLRTTMIPDPRASRYNVFFYEKMELLPMDFQSKSVPLMYGSYFNQWDPVAMVFVPPGTRFSVIGRSQSTSRPMFLLVNASEERPEGTGFLAEGNLLRLNFTAYLVARDTYLLSKNRYDVLRTHNVRSLSAEIYLEKISQHLKKAIFSIQKKIYDEAYEEALISWSLAYRAYSNEVMPLIDEASNSSLIFFILMIPSAYFMERLIFHQEGKKRFFSVLICGGLLIFVFSLVHPSLSIMRNSLMGLLGSIMLIMFGIIGLILYDESKRVVKEVSRSILGAHEVERGYVGTFEIAFTVAINNMRRRRLRTILTFLTVLAISLSLTAFTSTSSFTSVRSIPQPREAYYTGILVKKGFGVPPDGVMQPKLLMLIYESVPNECEVLPRVWYYPTSIGPNIGVVTTISSLGNQTLISAALGISSQESHYLSGLMLLAGRSFIETDYYACMLSDHVAKALNVSVGDVVEAFSVKLYIVAIFDSHLINQNFDLDGYPITPIDPLFVEELGIDVLAQTGLQKSPLPAERIIIIPYKLALDLGGYVSSVSVRFPENTTLNEIKRYADELSLSLDVDVYFSFQGNVYQNSRFRSYIFLGWNSILLIILIGSLNITISLLGNVKERTRDIFIFSATGLSPSGLTAIFIAESLIYVVLASLIGYYLGFILNQVFITAKIFPSSFTFNYASLFVALTQLIILLAAMISTIYPAYVSSKIITPSLKRKWEFSTRPQGDVWEIPFFSTYKSRDEVLGLIEYLKEYFSGAGAEKSKFTIREFPEASFRDLSLNLNVALYPYEANVIQSVKINFKREKDHFNMNVILKRISGIKSVWLTSSYYFVDDVRKQILLWNSASTNDKIKYIKKAKESITS